MIIAEAGFEYLINILVTGAFLARITTNLGFSDSLTGVLSAIASLGCIFQLTSVFIKTRKVKPLTIACTFISELLFLLLYVVPMVPLGKNGRAALFVTFLTLAYLAVMVTSAKKMNWFMSLVDDHKRGRFTANKEIISLAAGISFSYAMGWVIDKYQVEGDMSGAFTICAAVISVLLVLQLLCQVFTVEPPHAQRRSGEHLLSGFRSVFRDKTIMSLMLFLVIYRIGTYTATSFYGTYQIKELGFSQTLVVTLTAVGSVVRIVCSRFMGRYADRHSFARMERICLGFMMAAFTMVAIANPRNGKVFFTMYQVFHGIAMAGANSAITNLIFDNVPAEKCADALAVTQSASGLAGFLATLAAGSLVGRIQENGNCFLGIGIYAQQVTSIIAATIMGLCIVYVSLVFIRKRDQK